MGQEDEGDELRATVSGQQLPFPELPSASILVLHLSNHPQPGQQTQ